MRHPKRQVQRKTVRKGRKLKGLTKTEASERARAGWRSRRMHGWHSNRMLAEDDSHITSHLSKREARKLGDLPVGTDRETNIEEQLRENADEILRDPSKLELPATLSKQQRTAIRDLFAKRLKQHEDIVAKRQPEDAYHMHPDKPSTKSRVTFYGRARGGLNLDPKRQANDQEAKTIKKALTGGFGGETKGIIEASFGPHISTEDKKNLAKLIYSSHRAPTEKERVLAQVRARRLLGRLEVKADQSWEKQQSVKRLKQSVGATEEAENVARGKAAEIVDQAVSRDLAKRQHQVRLEGRDTAEDLYQRYDRHASRTKWLGERALANRRKVSFEKPEPKFFQGVRNQVNLHRKLVENKREIRDAQNLQAFFDKSGRPVSTGKLDELGRPQKDPMKRAFFGVIPNKRWIYTLRKEKPGKPDETKFLKETLPFHDTWTSFDDLPNTIVWHEGTESSLLPGQKGRVSFGNREGKEKLDKDSLVEKEVFIETPHVKRGKEIIKKRVMEGEKDRTAYIGYQPGLEEIKSSGGTSISSEHTKELKNPPSHAFPEGERFPKPITPEPFLTKDDSSVRHTRGKAYRVKTKEDWDLLPDELKERKFTSPVQREHYVAPGEAHLARGQKDTIQFRIPKTDQLGFINLSAEDQQTRLGQAARWGVVEPQKVKERYKQEELHSLTDASLPGRSQREAREIKAYARVKMEKDPVFRRDALDYLQKHKGYTDDDIKAAEAGQSRHKPLNDLMAATALATAYTGQRRFRQSVLPQKVNVGIQKVLGEERAKRIHAQIPIYEEAYRAPIEKGIAKKKFQARHILSGFRSGTRPGLRVNEYEYAKPLSFPRRFLTSSENLFRSEQENKLKELEVIHGATKRATINARKSGIRGVIGRHRAESVYDWREHSTVFSKKSQELRETLAPIASGEAFHHEGNRVWFTNQVGDIEEKAFVGEPGFFSRGHGRRGQLNVEGPLKERAHSMLNRIDQLENHDRITMRYLEKTGNIDRPLFPRAQRWSHGDITHTERNLLIGAGIVGVVAGGAYGYHKYKQHKERERGDEPRSFTNRVLPPAFRSPVPTLKTDISRYGTIPVTKFSDAAGVAGMKVPTKIDAKLERKRHAFRPADRGYDPSLPLVGRPKTKFRTGTNDVKFRDAVMVTVANPREIKAPPRGYKVSIAGKEVPGIIETSKPQKVKLTRVNKSKINDEDRERLVARYGNTGEQERIQQFYSADSKLQELFNDQQEITRLQKKHTLTKQGKTGILPA